MAEQPSTTRNEDDLLQSTGEEGSCTKRCKDPISNDETIADVTALAEGGQVYSPEQHKKLDQLESAVRDQFPPSKTVYYENASTLKQAVDAFCQPIGMCVTNISSSLQCTKHKKRPPNRKLKEKAAASGVIPRKSTTTRCNCPFVIKYTRAARAIDGAPPKAVRITNGSCYRHANGCFPSQGQLITARRSAGVYAKNLTRCQLQSLVNVLKSPAPVSACILRDLMRPMFPETVPIDAQLICNMRMKVKRIIKKEAEAAAAAPADARAEPPSPRGAGLIGEDDETGDDSPMDDGEDSLINVDSKLPSSSSTVAADPFSSTTASLNSQVIERLATALAVAVSSNPSIEMQQNLLGCMVKLTEAANGARVGDESLEETLQGHLSVFTGTSSKFDCF